jgi:hypothetical protein
MNVKMYSVFGSSTAGMGCTVSMDGIENQTRHISHDEGDAQVLPPEATSSSPLLASAGSLSVDDRPKSVSSTPPSVAVLYDSEHTLSASILTALETQAKGYLLLPLEAFGSASLADRAELLLRSSALIVLATWRIQSSVAASAPVHFCRDSKRFVVLAVAQAWFQPAGAFAAVADGAFLWVESLRPADAAKAVHERLMTEIANQSIASPPPALLDATPAPPRIAPPQNAAKVDGSVFISFGPDAAPTVDAIRKIDWASHSLAPTESCEGTGGLAAAASCAVLVVVVSTAWRNSPTLLAEVEAALLNGRPIVPLKTTAEVVPPPWLQLGMAGQLYYVVVRGGGWRLNFEGGCDERSRPLL